MKNPTPAEKKEIMDHVANILDKQDVNIHFSLSREMRQTNPGATEGTEEFEPTGALCAVVAVQSMPAIKWAEDLKAEQAELRIAEEEKK